MRTIRKKHARLVTFALVATYAILATPGFFCSTMSAEPEEPNDHEEHAGHEHDEEQSDEEVHDEDEHKGHDDENIIRLSDKDRHDIGIRTAVAKPGKLNIYTRLLGRVRINEDHLAHVVPLVSGITTEVNKRVGDHVVTGEVLAIIASRELAEFRAALLMARERRNLMLSAFEREKQLWQKKISSEQEYLDARQALAEAEIGVLAAEQSLHALGVSEEQLKQIGSMHDADLLTRFEIKASIGGTIIAKHITRGEKVGEDTDVFVIAGLDTVWIDLNVPQKDLSSIRKHQKVTISASGLGIADVTGEVGFVSPIIDEETRTAIARVVIPNTDGTWRPGLFVTALLTAKQLDADILVPNEAIQSLGGECVVFVPDEGGFKSLAISPGRSNRTHTEIAAGLRSGQEFVTTGAFELKAKIVTSGLDAHAGHGH